MPSRSSGERFGLGRQSVAKPSTIWYPPAREPINSDTCERRYQSGQSNRRTFTRRTRILKPLTALRPEEGDELVITERPQGTFTRQLLLGESLDTDRLEAD